MSGTDLIVAERQRQIEVEGWDADHDAGHADELALAGAVYALPEKHRKAEEAAGHVRVKVAIWGLLWPWADRWWKPTPNDRIRELVKAGALIAAAIDDLLAVR